MFRTNTPYCTSCWAERNRAYYQRDPEAAARKAREYRKKNPWVTKKINANAALKKMGVDMSWYEAKAAEQNHLCAICKKPELREGRSRLSIDHDHKCCSKKSSCSKCRRGLLCGQCNLMIGCANDDIEVLLSAVEYIKRWTNA